MPVENSKKAKVVKALKPIIKWAGGKQSELKNIIPEFPASFKNYYEPFIGGGAVYFATAANEWFINDRSTELVNLYKVLTGSNASIFIQNLKDMDSYWKQMERPTDKHFTKLQSLYKTDFTAKEIGKFIKKAIPNLSAPLYSQLVKSLVAKMRRMKALETTKGKLSKEDLAKNFETAFKAGYYTYIRSLYNNRVKLQLEEHVCCACFYFIHSLAFSGMFRYNADGGFNVPYGGIGYNKKDLQTAIKYFELPALKKKLSATVIDNLDFEEFLRTHKPTKKDFVFLDPPYDSEFSTYNKNAFTSMDQKRLADYLTKECKAQWMVVIKKTPLIEKLYKKKGLNISTFDKNYRVSFMNRNDKAVEHLIIKNY